MRAAYGALEKPVGLVQLNAEVLFEPALHKVAFALSLTVIALASASLAAALPVYMGYLPKRLQQRSQRKSSRAAMLCECVGEGVDDLLIRTRRQEGDLLGSGNPPRRRLSRRPTDRRKFRSRLWLRRLP